MAWEPAPFKMLLKDRLQLESWLRKDTLGQSLAVRARILLALHAGQTPKSVSEDLGVTAAMVFKWRTRYNEQGLNGLYDAPRPGQPKKLSQEKLKAILHDTVHKRPPEATHWSIRLMAKHAGVTPWQVQQIWKVADLKPHRLKTFKISNDPEFADKVCDVVGLYLNPPDNALVLSVDEKTQIQALERRALYRGVFASVDDLKQAIRRYIKTHNGQPAKLFRWHKSADAIIHSAARARMNPDKQKYTH